MKYLRIVLSVHVLNYTAWGALLSDVINTIIMNEEGDDQSPFLNSFGEIS